MYFLPVYLRTTDTETDSRTESFETPAMRSFSLMDEAKLHSDDYLFISFIDQPSFDNASSIRRRVGKEEMPTL